MSTTGSKTTVDAENAPKKAESNSKTQDALVFRLAADHCLESRIETPDSQSLSPVHGGITLPRNLPIRAIRIVGEWRLSLGEFAGLRVRYEQRFRNRIVGHDGFVQA